jgi:hypothetical protein
MKSQNVSSMGVFLGAKGEHSDSENRQVSQNKKRASE